MKQSSALSYVLLIVFFLLCSACAPKKHRVPPKELKQYDLVVYGGTPAGVASAVAAARKGITVALVSHSNIVGGMMSSGLGASDVGEVKVVGGFAKEFFLRVGEYYDKEVPIYRFEPKAAETVFESMLREAGVYVYYNSPIYRLTKRDGKIQSITSIRGEKLKGNLFIDASYEGDLMAKAGVRYSVGREGRETYGESLAGFQTENRRHIFPVPVVAVDEKGNPIRGVSKHGWAEVGTGDSKVPAYNFRLCLSKDSGNQIPFEKPKDYDPAQYELLARHISVNPGIKLSDLVYFFPLPNDKVDINNRGPVSTNLIGGSWEYPEAKSRRRGEIWQEHKTYAQGLFYFLLTDTRVPVRIRKSLANWGYCADEFEETGNWPPQLYIRAARRMTSDFVLTESDLRKNTRKPDSVGMASMPIESHHVQRLLTKKNTAANEGSVVVKVQPYEIPYRALVPRRGGGDEFNQSSDGVSLARCV